MFGINNIKSRQIRLNNKKITKVQKISLVAAAIIPLCTGSYSAMAEEASTDEKVERIEVTGSRIKRIAFEAASPVITITAADMEASGFSTVSDVLRNSSLNSFGSFGGDSNNGWSSQAEISLKGTDARQSLVLIDGVRLTKSPITGGSANLNMIPTAAIERIDILTDGASAVYGSDAVAGVINIVLKKEFSGLEMSAKYEFPDSVTGQDSEKFTLTGGLSGERGSMVFSWEHYEEDELLMSDLDYATAQLVEEGADPQYLDNWWGLSSTGRTIQQWSNGWNDEPLNLQGNCDVYNGKGSGQFIGQLSKLSDADDSVCAYDYTTAAQELPSTRRDAMMTNMTYELTDDIRLVARGMWMNQQTKDVSAGVPAWFPVDIALPGRTITTSTGETLDLSPVEEGGWFGYRMNTLGDREAEHNDTTLDLVVGLEGELGEITWDLSANYARYDAFTWGSNYASTAQLTDSVGYMDADGNWSGWDPRDPDSLPPASVRANFDKRRVSTQNSLRGGVQFDVMDLPGGTWSAYVGASHLRETYYSKIDGQAEAGNVAGGNGGSGGIGSRTASAVFVESVFPIFKNLEVNIAARHDDYSDFGTTTNPQVSISYRPTENLLIRGSAGTGFQAPLLTDLYSDNIRGYRDNEVNFIGCYNQGISLEDCNLVDEYWATQGGNKNLKAEESENTNIGVVWQFAEHWQVKADMWTLDTENRVTTISPSVIQLMQIQTWMAEGGSVPISSKLPGVDILLRGNSDILEIFTPNTNAGLREISGIDAALNGRVETQVGAFDIDLNWSHMRKYRTSFISEEGTVALGDDELGDVGRPQDRVNMSLTWTYNDHSLNLYSYYIASQKDTFTNDEGETEVFDALASFTGHNLTYTYFTPWHGKLALGVLNLTEEDTPRRSLRPREPYKSLYDIRGRVFTLSYTQSF
ncbi:TonB-dependent receptor plug domain-containing protein [Thalassotalea sediminis]|uniref:TonB-dependent receptor plug domain-containing protein n=1 Tax=Thalassotalea sediminis TaxID=1759089 RepID=UPI0025746BC3|nr:TonB-dependent receptor [Thalassotalea sediminis]